MSTIHRRDWLKTSSLAIAGFGISIPKIASAKGINTKQLFDDGPIRLSSNENPYGPSPMARKAMGEVINQSNRYPWDLASKLIDHFSHSLSCHWRRSIRIFVGGKTNGTVVK